MVVVRFAAFVCAAVLLFFPPSSILQRFASVLTLPCCVVEGPFFETGSEVVFALLDRSKGRPIANERASKRSRQTESSSVLRRRERERERGEHGSSQDGVPIRRDKGASICVECRQAVFERRIVGHGRNLRHSTRGHDQGKKMLAFQIVKCTWILRENRKLE